MRFLGYLFLGLLTASFCKSFDHKTLNDRSLGDKVYYYARYEQVCLYDSQCFDDFEKLLYEAINVARCGGSNNEFLVDLMVVLVKELKRSLDKMEAKGVNLKISSFMDEFLLSVRGDFSFTKLNLLMERIEADDDLHHVRMDFMSQNHVSHPGKGSVFNGILMADEFQVYPSFFTNLLFIECKRGEFEFLASLKSIFDSDLKSPRYVAWKDALNNLMLLDDACCLCEIVLKKSVKDETLNFWHEAAKTVMKKSSFYKENSLIILLFHFLSLLYETEKTTLIDIKSSVIELSFLMQLQLKNKLIEDLDLEIFQLLKNFCSNQNNETAVKVDLFKFMIDLSTGLFGNHEVSVFSGLSRLLSGSFITRNEKNFMRLSSRPSIEITSHEENASIGITSNEGSVISANSNQIDENDADEKVVSIPKNEISKEPITKVHSSFMNEKEKLQRELPKVTKKSPPKKTVPPKKEISRVQKPKASIQPAVRKADENVKKDVSSTNQTKKNIAPAPKVVTVKQTIPTMQGKSAKKTKSKKAAVVQIEKKAESTKTVVLAERFRVIIFRNYLSFARKMYPGVIMLRANEDILKNTIDKIPTRMVLSATDIFPMIAELSTVKSLSFSLNCLVKEKIEIGNEKIAVIDVLALSLKSFGSRLQESKDYEEQENASEPFKLEKFMISWEFIEMGENFAVFSRSTLQDFQIDRFFSACCRLFFVFYRLKFMLERHFESFTGKDESTKLEDIFEKPNEFLEKHTRSDWFNLFLSAYAELLLAHNYFSTVPNAPFVKMFQDVSKDHLDQLVRKYKVPLYYNIGKVYRQNLLNFSYRPSLECPLSKTKRTISRMDVDSIPFQFLQIRGLNEFFTSQRHFIGFLKSICAVYQDVYLSRVIGNIESKVSISRILFFFVLLNQPMSDKDDRIIAECCDLSTIKEIVKIFYFIILNEFLQLFDKSSEETYLEKLSPGMHGYLKDIENLTVQKMHSIITFGSFTKWSMINDKEEYKSASFSLFDMTFRSKLLVDLFIIYKGIVDVNNEVPFESSVRSNCIRVILTKYSEVSPHVVSSFKDYVLPSASLAKVDPIIPNTVILTAKNFANKNLPSSYGRMTLGEYCSRNFVDSSASFISPSGMKCREITEKQIHSLCRVLFYKSLAWLESDLRYALSFVTNTNPFYVAGTVYDQLNITVKFHEMGAPVSENFIFFLEKSALNAPQSLFFEAKIKRLFHVLGISADSLVIMENVTPTKITDAMSELKEFFSEEKTESLGSRISYISKQWSIEGFLIPVFEAWSAVVLDQEFSEIKSKQLFKADNEEKHAITLFLNTFQNEMLEKWPVLNINLVDDAVPDDTMVELLMEAWELMQVVKRLQIVASCSLMAEMATIFDCFTWIMFVFQRKRHNARLVRKEQTIFHQMLHNVYISLEHIISSVDAEMFSAMKKFIDEVLVSLFPADLYSYASVSEYEIEAKRIITLMKKNQQIPIIEVLKMMKIDLPLKFHVYPIRTYFLDKSTIEAHLEEEQQIYYDSLMKTQLTASQIASHSSFKSFFISYNLLTACKDDLKVFIEKARKEFKIIMNKKLPCPRANIARISLMIASEVKCKSLADILALMNYFQYYLEYLLRKKQISSQYFSSFLLLMKTFANVKLIEVLHPLRKDVIFDKSKYISTKYETMKGDDLERLYKYESDPTVTKSVLMRILDCHAEKEAISKVLLPSMDAIVYYKGEVADVLLIQQASHSEKIESESNIIKVIQFVKK